MTDFASRLRELRTERGLRQRDLAEELGVAQTTIANYEQNARFPDERVLCRVADYFDVSLDYLLGRADVKLQGALRRNPEGFHREEEEAPAPLTPPAREYLRLLLAGKREEAAALVSEALDSGTGARELYEGVFERSLREVGRLWAAGELDAGTEHFVSAATQGIMSRVYPRLAARARPRRPFTCVATSVCGEFHDIGVRMVADFLELDGWRCLFLGANLCNEDMVKAVTEHGADLLALSATMFFSVEAVARAVRAVRAAERLRGLPVMVGGRPFRQDPELWRRVGADAQARSASQAVEAAGRLVGRGTRGHVGRP